MKENKIDQVLAEMTVQIEQVRKQLLEQNAIVVAQCDDSDKAL